MHLKSQNLTKKNEKKGVPDAYGVSREPQAPSKATPALRQARVKTHPCTANAVLLPPHQGVSPSPPRPSHRDAAYTQHAPPRSSQQRQPDPPVIAHVPRPLRGNHPSSSSPKRTSIV